MTSKNHHHQVLLVATLALAALITPARAVQFRLFGWTSSDANLQFDANHQGIETQVHHDSLSPSYDFKSNGALVLYKRVEHEDKIVKQIACTVSIPEGAEQGLIILLPGDQSKAISRKVLPNKEGFVTTQAPLIYDYLWIDDSPKARPEGTIEFRNFSRLPVAFQVGDHRHSLDPQAKIQVPLVVGAKRMTFRAAAQFNGQWRVFATNPLPTRNPSRMMVIFRDGPAPAPSGEARPQVIALYDWPAPPPVPETPAPSLVSAR